jgi:hypothetical protein
MPSIIRRPWSLSIPQRMLVVLAATLYLAIYRPWHQTSPSIAAGVYAGSAAMLVLAVLPRRLRVASACLVAVAVSIAILFAGRAVLGGQP